MTEAVEAQHRLLQDESEKAWDMNLFRQKRFSSSPAFNSEMLRNAESFISSFG
jgi:hypothetical protein